ncbi:MAG: hemolysin family protein [Gemmatimonadota bacterium]
MDLLWKLLAVIGLVLANGFFVAAEFSLVAVRRTKIEQMVREGRPFAATLKRASQHLDAFIAACQLGITMASIGLGWIGEPALAGLFEPLFRSLGLDWAEAAAHTLAVICAFAIITALHVILGELAPKAIALQQPEATSLIVVTPLEVFQKMFRPFIWAMNAIGLGVVRALGFQPVSASDVAHSEEEINMLVRASRDAGILAREEQDMVQRALAFSDLSGDQVMVPRTEIIALPLHLPKHELLARVVDSGFTRFPVYRESLDDIVGILNVKDLLPALQRLPEVVDLAPFARPPVTLPETVSIYGLLARMKEGHSHLIVLIDEFGGTAGLVTLRDLMERVFGEVREESDGDERPLFEELSGGEVLIDGLTLIEDVEQALNVELDEEDPDLNTIGGYVFSALGHKPELGEVVERNGYRFTVEELDGMRIARVRFARVAAGETSAA